MEPVGGTPPHAADLDLPQEELAFREQQRTTNEQQHEPSYQIASDGTPQELLNRQET